jgi:hypothetical protein
MRDQPKVSESDGNMLAQISNVRIRNA